jgi:hypothetical protein
VPGITNLPKPIKRLTIADPSSAQARLDRVVTNAYQLRVRLGGGYNELRLSRSVARSRLERRQDFGDTLALVQAGCDFSYRAKTKTYVTGKAHGHISPKHDRLEDSCPERGPPVIGKRDVRVGDDPRPIGGRFCHDQAQAFTWTT